MPPVRRSRERKTPGRATGKSVKKQLFPSKKNNRRAQKGNRKGQDVLAIKTLLPNMQKVSITYRDSINFTSMGANTGGGAVSPTLMRFLLNDPSYGLGADRLGSVMIQPDTTTPLFVHENPSLNLDTHLQDYYNEYYNAVVVGSKIKVNLRFKPNQRGVGQYFENKGTGTEADPYALQIKEADKVGDGLFWAVSQKNSGTLNNQNPSLYQLKREIPGVTMKRMSLSRNGVASKGIQFQATYSPARSAGVKDWKDNIEDFNFSTTDRVNKPRYLYIGCTSQQQPLMSSINLANVYVDYQITYDIAFLNRKNVYGVNNPIARDHRDL